MKEIYNKRCFPSYFDTFTLAAWRQKEEFKSGKVNLDTSYLQPGTYFLQMRAG